MILQLEILLTGNTLGCEQIYALDLPNGKLKLKYDYVLTDFETVTYFVMTKTEKRQCIHDSICSLMFAKLNQQRTRSAMKICEYDALN